MLKAAPQLITQDSFPVDDFDMKIHHWQTVPPKLIDKLNTKSVTSFSASSRKGETKHSDGPHESKRLRTQPNVAYLSKKKILTTSSSKVQQPKRYAVQPDKAFQSTAGWDQAKNPYIVPHKAQMEINRKYNSSQRH